MIYLTVIIINLIALTAVNANFYIIGNSSTRSNFLLYKKPPTGCRKDYIRAAGMAVFHEFTGFILSCAFWFSINSYTHGRMCLTLTLLDTALIIFLMKTGKKADNPVRPDYTGCVILLAIIALALIFSHKKNEMYGMGQDEGTYQVRAMMMMSGDYDNYCELEEYKKLETAEQRQKYLDFTLGQNNLYLSHVEWELSRDAADYESIKGAVHGLPTYSALLALWAEIFGLDRMISVNSFALISILILLWGVCDNLGLKKLTKAFITLAAALSPLNIWLTKSSLTEIWLVLIVTAFLYCITDRNNPGAALMSGLPLVAFAFFHISFYAFIPIFVIVLWVMYLQTENRGYLISAVMACCSLFLSAWWATGIAPYYSIGNYSELFRIIKFMNQNNLMWIILTSCLVCIAISAFLATSGGKAVSEIIKRTAVRRQTVLVNLVRIFLVLAAVYYAYRGLITAESKKMVEYLQISAYIYMSGIIAVPLVCLLLFFKSRVYTKEASGVVMQLLFLYSVIFYSCVMRVTIPHYYYYSRYSALMLPLIFVMLGYGLEQISDGTKTAVFHNTAIQLSFVIILLSFIPYDLTLINHTDHTRAGWDYVQRLAGSIKPESALIIGREELEIVFDFPLKALSGCDIYYCDFEENGAEEELTLLEKYYSQVYYLDYGDRVREIADLTRMPDLSVRTVFRENDRLSYFDYFNIRSRFSPIPTECVEYEHDLELSEITY